MKLNLLIILTFIFIGGVAAFAQSSSPSGSPKIAGKTAQLINDPNLKELIDLLGDPDLVCKKRILFVTGTVGKLILNNDGATLSAFWIRTGKKTPFDMNVNNDPDGSVGKYSVETIKSVI